MIASRSLRKAKQESKDSQATKLTVDLYRANIDLRAQIASLKSEIDRQRSRANKAEGFIKDGIELLRTWTPPGINPGRWGAAADDVIARLERGKQV